MSLPTTSMPANASDFAESPSVKIIVHSFDLFVPAKLASSSFGIPKSLLFFLAPTYLFNLASSFAAATYITNSTSPESSTSFKNLSDSS